MSTNLTDHTPASLESVREKVNYILQTHFSQRIEQAREIDSSYAELWQTAADLTLAGGKRLRPYLTVLGYQAFGGEQLDDILPIATAQELLHASLLIHDDIIDRDYVRYGRANISGSMQTKYQTFTKNLSDTVHYADSAALLAGDLLLADAHQLMLKGSFDNNQRSTALEIFSRGIFDVAGGEFLDTEAVLKPIEQVDSLVIAQYKTASYSIVAPLCIGAALAGADNDSLAALRTFGRHIGIAYQLVDDMLGLFGAQEKTGKPTLSDIHEGKRTYILQIALEYAGANDRTFILGKLGDASTNETDMEHIRTIVLNCGAKQVVDEAVNSHKQAALETLSNISMLPDVQHALQKLVSSALKRQK